MDNFSDYLENKVLDHITGTAAFAAPSATYAALYTVSPDDTGGGVEVSNAGGSLYDRVLIAWDPAASGAISNSNTLRFPLAGGAGTSWGNIVAIGILDSLTAGNLLVYGPLSATISVNTGDSFTLAPGGLAVTVS